MAQFKEPIVIRTVLKLMEVCCLHFMRNSYAFSLNASLRFLIAVFPRSKQEYCNLYYKSQRLFDEKETLKFGDLNKTIFFLQKLYNYSNQKLW
jgi:hypothetical protein